jgi:hypothetical protein
MFISQNYIKIVKFPNECTKNKAMYLLFVVKSAYSTGLEKYSSGLKCRV